MLYSFLKIFFSEYTIRLLYFDLLCRATRLKTAFQRNVNPTHDKLHLGCGKRKVKGWVNSDLRDSDFNVDYTQGFLPWRSFSFDVIVSQHLVEHLELTKELIPLLKELKRILKRKGEIWLSCPDLKKVCESYIHHKMKNLLADRNKRFPYYSLGEIPPQFMINDFFHQYANIDNPYGFHSLDWTEGAHKNLFDFEILSWALIKAGFIDITEVSEKEFLKRFPDFPARNDEMQALYIKASII